MSAHSKQIVQATSITALVIAAASIGGASGLDSVAATHVDSSAPPVGRPQASAPPADATGENSDQVDAWRLDLELDLLDDILADGPRLVAGGGPLAKDGEAVALVARALFLAGRESLALDLLHQARPATESGHAWIELELARIAIQRDELTEALSRLLPAPNQPPRRAALPEAWLLAGRALARLGGPAESEPYLSRFLELAPRHPEAASAWHLRAQAAIARRDGAAATAHRQRAEAASAWRGYLNARRLQKRRAPEAPLPRLGIAQLWMQVGELKPARTELEELVALAPSFARGHSHLGRVLEGLGSPRAARRAYDRALELEPDNVYALFHRGRSAAEAGDAPRAIEDWARLVEMEGAESEQRLAGALGLARLYDALGEKANALAAHAKYEALGGSEPLRPASDGD